MKVIDKKSVQSLLKVDDLKQNKIYLNKKKQMDIYKYIWFYYELQQELCLITLKNIGFSIPLIPTLW